MPACHTGSRQAFASLGEMLCRGRVLWLPRALWHTVSVLLILSILLLLYSTGWEISTRRYLRCFSDAIVPATAPADEKVDAILKGWLMDRRA